MKSMGDVLIFSMFDDSVLVLVVGLLLLVMLDDSTPFLAGIGTKTTTSGLTAATWETNVDAMAKKEELRGFASGDASFVFSSGSKSSSK